MTGALPMLGLALAVTMLPGCADSTGPPENQDVTVEGTITMEGAPASGAQVEIHGREAVCDFLEGECRIGTGTEIIASLARSFTDSKGEYRVTAAPNRGCEDLSLFVAFPPLALSQRVELPDCGSFVRNVDLRRIGD